jgi:hypothetical protein
VAVDCTLEDERGAELARVDDPSGVLNSLIPDYADERFQCWRFIDEHSDTVFNRGQMPQFLQELAAIRAGATKAAALNVLDSVERLAVRCRDDVHLCLKFYGD